MKRNFHTHTTFCDGKNTPEEMAAAAFEKGFGVLGFSGHSYTFFDDTWCMSRKGTQEYQSRVLDLKDKYAGKMKIYLGVEQDLYSTEGTYGYDFAIGSVHYVLKDGKYWPVDESAEHLRRAIDTGWEGDAYAFAEDYFSAVSQWADRDDAAIVGHFDLLCKFNKDGEFFDENHPRYLAAAQSAINALLAAGKIFEINTGAMARGYRNRPYPSYDFIEYIAKRGGRLILSSDCHDAEFLDYGFRDENIKKFAK